MPTVVRLPGERALVQQQMMPRRQSFWRERDVKQRSTRRQEMDTRIVVCPWVLDIVAHAERKQDYHSCHEGAETLNQKHCKRARCVRRHTFQGNEYLNMTCALSQKEGQCPSATFDLHSTMRTAFPAGNSLHTCFLHSIWLSGCAFGDVHMPSNATDALIS